MRSILAVALLPGLLSTAAEAAGSGRGMPVPWRQGVNVDVHDGRAATVTTPLGAQGRANAFFAPRTTFRDGTRLRGARPQRQFETLTRVVGPRRQVRLLRERVTIVARGLHLEVAYRAEDVTRDGVPPDERAPVVDHLLVVDYPGPPPSAAALWAISRGNAVGLTDLGYYGILAQARTAALKATVAEHPVAPLLARSLEAMALDRSPSP